MQHNAAAPSRMSSAFLVATIAVAVVVGAVSTQNDCRMVPVRTSAAAVAQLTGKLLRAPVLLLIAWHCRDDDNADDVNGWGTIAATNITTTTGIYQRRWLNGGHSGYTNSATLGATGTDEKQQTDAPAATTTATTLTTSSATAARWKFIFWSARHLYSSDVGGVFEGRRTATHQQQRRVITSIQLDYSSV